MNKMKTRKNRKLHRGGDAIAGAQGCVIIPSLIVDSGMKTRNVNYVTKIFFTDEDYEEEKRNNDVILASIDPAGSFTSAKYTTTVVDARYLTPKELDVCTQLKGRDLRNAKYLNYKFLGKSIAEIVNTDMKITPDISRGVISAIANISVKVLNLNNNLGRFHNDIHEGNVMYNFKDEHAYLIDFGGLSATPKGDNQLADFQGIVTTARFFAISTVGQNRLPKPLIGQLNGFIKDSTAVLIRSSEQDPKQARTLISKFLTDFALKYTTSIGGKKTLRRKVHRNVH